MDATVFNAIATHEERIQYANLLSNKYFHLIILPTELCNFRCTYCYEDFAVGRMEKDTISSTKYLLEKRCASNLEVLKVSWFGGEPLTAKDIVLEISDYAMALSHKYPNLHYSGTMTTNGSLLDYNTASALADVGVKAYQISLDGPRDVHNKSRVRADGSGSFDRIWANLLAIRDSSLPISVLLRLHFTVDTFKLFDPLIEDIRREFIHDPRFSVFFKGIERLGGPNDTSIKVFSESDENQVIQSLTTKLFAGNLASTQNFSLKKDYTCYAARPNSLIIRSNGDVGKCTVALYDERNKIGSLQPDGTIKVIPGRFAPWVRGVKTLDPETLACPLINLPSTKEIASRLEEKVTSR